MFETSDNSAFLAKLSSMEKASTQASLLDHLLHYENLSKVKGLSAMSVKVFSDFSFGSVKRVARLQIWFLGLQMAILLG